MVIFLCLLSLQAEEQRQAVIDKQNHKLLQRIVDIMTSKKKRFPVASNTNETKRKVTQPKQRHDDIFYEGLNGVNRQPSNRGQKSNRQLSKMEKPGKISRQLSHVPSCEEYYNIK